MKRGISTILIYLLFVVILHAQSISISVSADEVSVGEPFLVTYTIDGQIDKFDQPVFEGFTVYQTGQSTNVSIVHGKASRSTSYNFTLVASQTGTFEIAAVTAIINGKKVQSPSFVIEVMNQAHGPRSQQTPQHQQPKQSADRPSEDWRQNVILLAEVDKNKAYIGEQVTVTYRLLRRIDMQSVDISKLPLYKGFLSEEMKVPREQAEGIIAYQGKRFHAHTFRKVALYASQSGSLEIDPMLARGVIYVQEVDPFFGTTFFSTQIPQDIELKSNTLTVEIMPLPQEKQPKNFSGAVGQFQAQRNISNSKIELHESAQINISIAGNGNLKAITQPKIKLPSTIESFDPEMKLQSQQEGNQLGGQIEYDYAIVPKVTGSLSIPQDEFVFFDPQKKEFITEILPEIQIEVLPSEGHLLTDHDLGETFDSQLKDNSSAYRNRELLPIPIALASSIPLLALTGLLIRRRKKLHAAQIHNQPTMTWPVLAGISERDSYPLVANALRQNLRTQLQIDSLSDKDILQAITDNSIQKKISFILVSCDRAIYSPMVASPASDLLQLAQDSLAQINPTA